MKRFAPLRVMRVSALVAGAFLGQALAQGPPPTAGQAASTSSGQAYPIRPVRHIVPFTPGGGTDILARIVGAKMGESMGQQVIVDNRPGANTLIATEIVVRAAPDGYTLILQTNNLASNLTLYRGKIMFDTQKDLAPVSLVAGNPHVLVVYPGLPAKSLRDYIALAKEKPGTITFASAGSGTVNHLFGELLKMLAAITAASSSGRSS